MSNQPSSHYYERIGIQNDLNSVIPRMKSRAPHRFCYFSVARDLLFAILASPEIYYNSRQDGKTPVKLCGLAICRECVVQVASSPPQPKHIMLPCCSASTNHITRPCCLGYCSDTRLDSSDSRLDFTTSFSPRAYRGTSLLRNSPPPLGPP